MRYIILALVLLPSAALADAPVIHTVNLSDQQIESLCKTESDLAQMSAPANLPGALQAAAQLCGGVTQLWASSPAYVAPRAKAGNKK